MSSLVSRATLLIVFPPPENCRTGVAILANFTNSRPGRWSAGEGLFFRLLEPPGTPVPFRGRAEALGQSHGFRKLQRAAHRAAVAKPIPGQQLPGLVRVEWPGPAGEKLHPRPPPPPTPPPPAGSRAP